MIRQTFTVFLEVRGKQEHLLSQSETSFYPQFGKGKGKAGAPPDVI